MEPPPELARATAATQTAKAYTNPQVEFFSGHQSARNVPSPGTPGLLQHYAVSQALEIPAERRSRQQVAQLARIEQRLLAGWREACSRGGRKAGLL